MKEYRYKFSMNHDDGETKSETTFSGDAEVLEAVLEDFKLFLHGCGYYGKHVDSISLGDEYHDR